MMETIADILLVSGALAAGFYCFVLSKRLNAFKATEGGIGDAVTALSAQVDELSRSIAAARDSAATSSATLVEMTTRAENVAQRLELLVASMHDIKDVPETPPEPTEPVFSTRVQRAAG